MVRESNLGAGLAALPMRHMSVSPALTSYSALDTCSEPPRCNEGVAQRLKKRNKGEVGGSGRRTAAIDSSRLRADASSSKSSRVGSGSVDGSKFFSNSRSSYDRKIAACKSVSSRASSKAVGTSSRSGSRNMDRSHESVSNRKSMSASCYSKLESKNTESKSISKSVATRCSSLSSVSKKKELILKSSSSRGTRSRHEQKGHSAGGSKSTKEGSARERSRQEGVDLHAITASRATVDPPTCDWSTPTVSTSSVSSRSMGEGVSPHAIVPYDPPSRDTRRTIYDESVEKIARSSTLSETSAYGEGTYSESELESVAEDTNMGGELVVAVTPMVVSISDAHALVPADHHENHPSQALVLRDEQRGYLVEAVTNELALAPFNCEEYEAYDHTYVTCPEGLRFRFLYSFLKKNVDRKVIIFFSTTQSAMYHSKLLEHFHIPVLTIHGRQKKERFINTFFQFSDIETGILCATDADGRELDIPPSVDWVIQFEPPDDPSEYISRVTRISCDPDRVGRSLLFLNPGESGFLTYYHAASIPVGEFELPRVAEIQAQIEHCVNGSESFQHYSRDAYGSYLIAYASHRFRDVYNVHDLNKSDVAKAFGISSLPEADDRTAGEDESLDYSHGETDSFQRRIRQKAKMKKKNMSWMTGEKSWPHCKVRDNL